MGEVETFFRWKSLMVRWIKKDLFGLISVFYSTVHEFLIFCDRGAIGWSVVKGAWGSLQIKTLPNNMIGFTAEINRKCAGCKELVKNWRNCTIENVQLKVNANAQWRSLQGWLM